MTRFAIYARFSSENQNEKSADDQVRECRDRVRALGGTVADAHIFTDIAISGSHVVTRPGIIALMTAAKARAFDAVIADDLSRLSRDQEDIAGIYKRLAWLDVGIVTLLEGKVDELHIGFKGTQNAVELKRIAHSVRRGQKGRVAQGRIPGGNAYGYDLAREIDGRGELVRGLRRINESQAAIVRRIFADYAAGNSPRAIAHALNREGVPGPSGRQWMASTINGNTERGIGILNNRLYEGVIVYNRQRFVKNPDTGRRQARPNPPGEWLTQPAPQLRIVDAALWQDVQSRRRAIARQGFAQGPRPKHLLTGLVKCGICGGSYTVTSGAKAAGGKRLGCATRKEKGTCGNAGTIVMAQLEDRVFTGLRRYLKQPEGLRFFVEEFHRHLRELRAESVRDRARLEKQLAQAQRKIDAIIKAVEEGLYSPDMKQRLADLNAEKERLAAAIAAGDDDGGRVVDFVPSLGGAYEKYVDRLRETLAADETRAEAVAALRGLIERIIVKPKGAPGKGLDVEIEGNLAAILHFIQGDPAPLQRALAAPGRRSSVVPPSAGSPNGAIGLVAGACNIRYRADPPLHIAA